MSKQTTTSKSPTYVAYHVRDGKPGGKGYWTRIGAAWAHANGKGFNIEIAAIPLDGRIVLTLPSEPTGEQKQ